MTGFRRLRPLALIAWTLTACLGLAACDSEPSDADMKAALNRAYGGVSKELGAVGKLIGKDLGTKVTSVKKLACVKAEGKPGYACDFEMAQDGPLGQKSERGSGRFVKSDGGGWAVLEK